MSELNLNAKQEQLLRVMREASKMWRSSLEETFPELFSTRPKDGEWAVLENPKANIHGNQNTLILYRKSQPLSVGFDIKGKWCDEMVSIPESKLVKAGLMDVEAQLQVEAIERGFICGARFDANFCFPTMVKTDYVTVKSGPMLLSDGILTIKCLNSNNEYMNYAIFKDGQWATPVNVCTKEEAQKEFGILIVD